MRACDVTGQRFGRLTALYRTQPRGADKRVAWHCRCDCGNEIDITYNELRYTSRQSCGCQRREHGRKLPQYLTHVGGTSLDILRSSKLPATNTTGVKGVYLIRGKFTAKIVFQRKQYYLGTYDTMEEAVQARRAAEQLLRDGTLDHYERWRARAEQDPDWAAQNPVEIRVSKTQTGVEAKFLPEME